MPNQPSQTQAREPERPHERVRAVGARNMTVGELLTLVVGSGFRGGSALQVAEAVLQRFPSLSLLAAADVSEIERVPGVGVATACRLAGALDLGRRTASDAGPSDEPIRGPSDVFRRMGPRLRDVGQEEFHTLLLNTRHQVFREVLVTRGILDASLIHPREVFRVAVGEGAAGIILVHNHPSGDPAPSAEDRAVTRQLGAAGRALGIPVLDHVIVGRGRYSSLAADLRE
ncbi:MAG: RadC family protein [Longimicrobiales bacterium]